MKKLVIGITAHVDAGKTTLSEAMLYKSGAIRKAGRVDKGDAFLDTAALEKERGITIFSKQAVFTYKDMDVTLLDTPGHVDFSAEMERTLQVLDYVILVISGADGVQGHTRTLWKLLKKYQIPVFLFVNKMDQPGADKEALLAELKERLADGCISFKENPTEEFFESAAMEDEAAMEEFLSSGTLKEETITELIAQRKIFPCFFGSALKMEGIESFLEGVFQYTRMPEYPEEFGARVFKIARDEQKERLTYLKITGGSLKVKSLLDEQKINQIRIYSGNRYELANEVFPGTVCAVTGLEKSFPGEGFGMAGAFQTPMLAPVLTYQVILPEGCDAAAALPKLRQLEEENPELHIVWNETLQEIQAQLMGEVQIEILKRLIFERFGMEVSFGAGNIVYKETITNTVEGVGHFEPLRHYAEVHLLLEPAEPGSGLCFVASCSEDMLAKNWQRLILTHLEEKEHLGVLTGSAITDMKITLIAGRAHQKHTEGGDFRQATYRAVRQGLMQAESLLLEPYYEFRLEVPMQSVGRAMADIEKMHGTFVGPFQEGDLSVLTGSVPVVCMQDYQKEVAAYTGGIGKLFLSLKGYEPCHNAAEVIVKKGYDPNRDLENTPDSVFCAHGSGFVVSWDQVQEYMHIQGLEIRDETIDEAETEQVPSAAKEWQEEKWINPEEVDAILARTYQANQHAKSDTKKWKREKRTIAAAVNPSVPAVKQKTGEEYLLVDGYNIIFAWEELKELAKINIDSARGKLLDILCNYQGMKKCNLIVVFDAYRVQGHKTEIFDYHNIHVVYTKEAETADAYIEKFAHENAGTHRITVATSDGLEQIIIRGAGCRLFSAREFEAEVKNTGVALKEKIEEMTERTHHYLLDDVSDEIKNIGMDSDIKQGL